MCINADAGMAIEASKLAIRPGSHVFVAATRACGLIRPGISRHGLEEVRPATPVCRLGFCEAE